VPACQAPCDALWSLSCVLLCCGSLLPLLTCVLLPNLVPADCVVLCVLLPCRFIPVLDACFCVHLCACPHIQLCLASCAPVAVALVLDAVADQPDGYDLVHVLVCLSHVSLLLCATCLPPCPHCPMCGAGRWGPQVRICATCACDALGCVLRLSRSTCPARRCVLFRLAPLYHREAFRVNMAPPPQKGHTGCEYCKKLLL